MVGTKTFRQHCSVFIFENRCSKSSLTGDKEKEQDPLASLHNCSAKYTEFRERKPS